MRKTTIALFAGAGLLGFGNGALAQEAQGRQVDIELQLKALHDTNVARSDAATAALRGIERSDTILSPALLANVLVPVSRQSVFLRGSIGRDYYQKNDILSSGRYDATAGANLNVGLCRGVLSGSYLSAQSDLQDISLLVTKNIARVSSVGFDVDCGRSAGLAPTFGISEVTAHNSAASLKMSDYHSVRTTAGLAYRRPSFGVITLFGEHNDTEYPNRLVPIGPGLAQDGYESNAFGIRYDRHLGARISGLASISRSKVSPDSPLIAEFEGWTYMAQIDYRASSRINTSLSFDRNVQPTIQSGAAYAVNQTLALNATYGLGSKLTLSGGLARADNRYKGVLPGQLSKEEIDIISGAARYAIGRRISLQLDLRHEERDANVAGFDYSSTQAGVTAIGKF